MGGMGGGNMMGMAIAGYNIVGGQVNMAKANAEGNFLEKTKPVKKTSQFDKDALSLTGSDLANGMSAEADQAYNDTTDRSLSSSISAILKSGGSANNIGDVYGDTQQGMQNMAIMRDQMRMAKVDKYLKSLDTMAEEEEKNWVVNDYTPYINKLKAVGEAKKAAAAQTAKGLDSLGSSGGGGNSGGGGGMMGGMMGMGGSGGGVSGGGGGGFPGGGISGGGGGGTIGSDKRLKHNIVKVGKSPSGINIYNFSYIGSNTRWQGVLADEVGYASVVGEGGFKWVDYDLIDVQFKQV